MTAVSTQQAFSTVDGVYTVRLVDVRKFAQWVIRMAHFRWFSENRCVNPRREAALERITRDKNVHSTLVRTEYILGISQSNVVVKQC